MRGWVCLGSEDSIASGNLVNVLLEVGEFVRRFRASARYGDLSRARLELLRVEIRGSHAECDWMARPGDRWDAGLRNEIADRNASTQALRDAIGIRALLFRAMPELRSAELRVYRRRAGELELIVSGDVTPGLEPPKTVQSVAMRAKLLGLRFWMSEGILETLDREKYVVNL